MPSDLATFKIPTPFASCFRTLRSVVLSIFGRPSFTPWCEIKRRCVLRCLKFGVCSSAVPREDREVPRELDLLAQRADALASERARGVRLAERYHQGLGAAARGKPPRRIR